MYIYIYIFPDDHNHSVLNHEMHKTPMRIPSKWRSTKSPLPSPYGTMASRNCLPNGEKASPSALNGICGTKKTKDMGNDGKWGGGVNTLPKTNISLQDRPSQNGKSFSQPPFFPGAILVLGGETREFFGTPGNEHHIQPHLLNGGAELAP